LKRLRDLGNTVVVVEHDDQIMREADYIIDVGPFASHLGGEIIAAGTYKEILKNKKSLTAQYLNGDLKVGIEKPIRKVVNKITLTNCTQHNLNDVTVTFPLNMLCVVTGVSGSGKTSLIKHILYPALKNAKGDFSVKPGVPNMYGALGAEANAIYPGKRMLSSMTPTIILKNNQPYLVVGTPGGTTIPTSIIQSLVNMIDFKMSPEDAVNLPKFHHQWLPDEIIVEKDFNSATIQQLEAMGYKVVKKQAIGRTELIEIKYGKTRKITAIADKRGDDTAEGY
jgi:energy-coupling factor transporter ATP-binding protein EcfA2